MFSSSVKHVKQWLAHLFLSFFPSRGWLGKNTGQVYCTEVFFFLPDHVSIFQKVPLHQKLHPHQPVLVLHPESQCRLHQRHRPVCWREPGPLLGVDGGQISQQYTRHRADSRICCVIELPGDRDRKEERLVSNIVHSSSNMNTHVHWNYFSFQFSISSNNRMTSEKSGAVSKLLMQLDRWISSSAVLTSSHL